VGELSLRIAGAAACLLLVSSGSGAAAGFPGIARVRALPDSLAVELTGRSPSARLVELRPYETVASQRQGAAVWAGPVNGQTVRLPRFADGRDRLYSRFQLVSDKTLRAIGPPCWVTDLEALPAWRFPMPWPASKKGVTCPVDMDDLHALGARYADWGVVLAGIFDWTGGPPKETWEVDGQHLPINVHYIAWLDGLVRRATELGVNVTLIPINGVPDHADAGNPLIHPRTDPAAAPNHIGAFNLTGERGLRYYRAAFEYLARRYSDPSGEHGWVSGYVVGNELQSHWAWHHMGRASREEVTREYADQLRIAWLAVRRFHKSVRVYASMDHTWASRLEPDPMKGMPGDWFLERLNRTIAREGNFPWDVAFHPYPEDLFEPRFWNDQTAVMGFDSPRITFRNLEVLPAFLSQQRFLYRGRPRRIILSEQGFHCPDGPDGEAVQAAAFALAYEKVRHMPSIDAFILHRHVDHADHGPLLVGMWTRKLDADDPEAPDRKRMIWDVFQAAGTGRWPEAIEFAKPIIGIRDWAEALPYAGPIPRVSGCVAPPPDPGTTVADLWALMGDAKLARCLAWSPAWAKGADGLLYPAILQHPPDPREGVAEATFDLDLPRVRPGRELRLELGTTVTGPTFDGVRMSVSVGGRDVWNEVQPTQNQPRAHSVDLTAWAGARIALTLRVDALGNNGADWAHWLRPVVVVARLPASRVGP